MKRMPTLQVRNVPDDVGRVLKARAAGAGLSLSEYVLRELRAIAGQPTIEELSARIETRGRADMPVSLSAILAEERAERA